MSEGVGYDSREYPRFYDKEDHLESVGAYYAELDYQGTV